MPGLTPAPAQKQSQKWDTLFFPILLTAQIWHPLSVTCFGPVKDALHRRHFADNNELKQSFREVLRSRGTEFYNTVENDGDLVEKQPHDCKRRMNHLRKFHCYCNNIFWEKKLEALLSHRPLLLTHTECKTTAQ
jgi:hypothetical protein